MTKVMIVEDDTRLRRAITISLKARGYDVEGAQEGTTALRIASSTALDLVTLDLGLPDIDGLEIIQALRGWTDVPIIVLSARESQAEIVRALDAGADDYVTKPFSHRELVARIRAVLRRGQDVELLPDVVEAAGVRMDVERHEVTVGGQRIRLALKEFELLELLLRNAGRVLTRGQLIDRVWGADYVGDTKTLDVHVKRLRTKIEPDPTNPRFLITVRGLGYKFEG